MKIGIFGGSFNPPHKMHKHISLTLLEKKYLDKVIFVPTGNKYNKQNLISDLNRYNMLKIMVKNNEGLLVSDYEFKSELTYTYQTLDYFKKLLPNDEIYFICGADNLESFDTWRKYQYILSNYPLLVINRDSKDINKIIKKYDLYKNLIKVLNIEERNISSTIIRDRLKNNLDTTEYLESEILEYIKNNNLYIQ